MYGTQTRYTKHSFRQPFENDVKMYGTQTLRKLKRELHEFENDVKMYGTQTNNDAFNSPASLRMM